MSVIKKNQPKILIFDPPSRGIKLAYFGRFSTNFLTEIGLEGGSNIILLPKKFGNLIFYGFPPEQGVAPFGFQKKPHPDPPQYISLVFTFSGSSVEPLDKENKDGLQFSNIHLRSLILPCNTIWMNLRYCFVQTPSNGRVLQGFNSDEKFQAMYKKSFSESNVG